MNKLAPDSKAPALSVGLVGGGTWTLADRTPENFTMVVAYRGLHCPVCKGYLGGLDKIVGDYAKAGVDVVAVSMNDEETATRTREEWGLKTLDVGYGLDEATAKAWGLYLSRAIRDTEPAIFSEPGLYLVRPDGRVYLANVSNMPWGRPDLAELLGKIGFALERNYPARGTAS